MPWSWGRGNELPESFKGKSPEDIEKELQEKAELKTKLEESEKKVSELSTKFESFSTDFDQKLDARFATVIEQLKPKQQQQNTNQTMSDFLTEPDKAFVERAAPLTALALSSAAYIAKNEAKQKLQRLQRDNPGKNFDGHFFEKFETEILGLSRQVPAQQLANPETWEHIYYNVKGRHAEEIAAQMHDGTLQSSIESGSTGARGGDFGEKKDAPLTDQEKRIASKMGVTEAQYALRKKEISGVGINV